MNRNPSIVSTAAVTFVLLIHCVIACADEGIRNSPKWQGKVIGLDDASQGTFAKAQAALRARQDDRGEELLHDMTDHMQSNPAAVRAAMLSVHLSPEHAQYHPHLTKECDLLKGLKEGDEFDARGHAIAIISESLNCPICNPPVTIAEPPAIEQLQKEIVKSARDKIGSHKWDKKEDSISGRTVYGCNQFVFDTLCDAVGQCPPLRQRNWRPDVPPLAGDWADPGHEIAGYRVLSEGEEPRPGDIVGYRESNASEPDALYSGHVGIVSDYDSASGTGKMISANPDKGVRETEWKQGGAHQYVVRRIQ